MGGLQNPLETMSTGTELSRRGLRTRLQQSRKSANYVILPILANSPNYVKKRLF